MKETEDKDLTTEDKIRAAAFKIFQQKGFAGTKTRDIAEEAGINLALLNYYYRSKEKLFNIVMEESLKQLFSRLLLILGNPTTTISYKIDTIVDLYINLLKENPNIPLFILSELQANPENLWKIIGSPDFLIQEVAVIQQIEEQMKKSGVEYFDPFHIIINVVSMTIFPFAAKPLVKILNKQDDDEFEQFIETRRKMIPVWIKAMLKIEE